MRRMEKINMKCQARGQAELVFPGWQEPGATAEVAEQRVLCTEEGRHFRGVRNMNFIHFLIR